MTNNIIIKSSQIKIDVNFTVEHQKELNSKATPKILNTEVLAIGLSNQLYRIKTFDPYIPVMDMDGYGLLFFKSSKGYVIYLQKFEEQNLYNLQSAFDIKFKSDSRRFCYHEYLNSKNEVSILMNFETESLHVTVNGKKCIDYKINKRLFPEPKVALTFGGYSSSLSPIQLKMHETSIYKGTSLSSQEFEPTFHNDVDTFIRNVDKYDPLHNQNASFSNVMLTQVR